MVNSFKMGTSGCFSVFKKLRFITAYKYDKPKFKEIRWIVTKENKIESI
jgi:hypothetical protein